MPPPRQDCPN
ncbi:hypothetical protein E2C01_025453 [Portunus trituberculatus]|uniref:Uncharacterized protein n=1 Tax=Portunus trituberculatus TaxID=210409 RepID=A0A5B7EFZ3_PORTR|nr:hypothetical protein [Portunus trituberculatus]